MKNIIIYSQAGCPYCQEIKDLLTQAGIAYVSKDIDEKLAHIDSALSKII